MIENIMIIGLVAGFFLLGFMGAYVWFRHELVKQYEEFCKKLDKACDEVANYYEHRLRVQEKKLKGELGLDLDGFREWLKKQKSKKSNNPYSSETVRKYVAKLETGFAKTKRDSLETTAYGLYEKYLKSK